MLGDVLAAHVLGISVVVGVHAMPLAAWHTLSPSRGIRYRVAWGIVALLLLYAGTIPAFSTAVFNGVVAAVYYGCVAVGVFYLAQWLRRKKVGVIMLLVFLMVPTLALPATMNRQLATSSFLVVGWSLWLKSTGYCLDLVKGSATRRFSDSLFFFCVSPSLLFRDRGVVDDAGRLHWGLLRVAYGMATMLSAYAIDSIWTSTPDQTRLWLAAGALGTTKQLCLHSGLASIRIGLMRCGGYRVPECYNFPFLAVSPLDIWRRWNIYVGSWVNYYVFRPWVRAWRASYRRYALTAAMLTSGVIHEVYAYWNAGAFSGTFVSFFLAAAVAGEAWRLLERAIGHGESIRWLGRAVTLFLIALAGAVWSPVG